MVVFFKADHLKYLLKKFPDDVLTFGHADLLEQKQAHSFTVMHKNRVLACGGVVKYTNARGEAWAKIDQTAREHFLKIHNAARRIIATSGFNRVEATTGANFANGCRWLKLLGFEFEGVMKKYNLDGSDMALFARIKAQNV